MSDVCSVFVAIVVFVVVDIVGGIDSDFKLSQFFSNFNGVKSWEDTVEHFIVKFGFFRGGQEYNFAPSIFCGFLLTVIRKKYDE